MTIVCGALGRMGRRVIAIANEDDRFQIIAGIVERKAPQSMNGLPLVPGTELQKYLKGAEVLVDFSAPEATLAFAEAATQGKKAIVIGTTGFDAGQKTKD